MISKNKLQQAANPVWGIKGISNYLANILLALQNGYKPEYLKSELKKLKLRYDLIMGQYHQWCKNSNRDAKGRTQKNFKKETGADELLRKIKALEYAMGYGSLKQEDVKKDRKYKLVDKDDTLYIIVRKNKTTCWLQTEESSCIIKGVKYNNLCQAD